MPVNPLVIAAGVGAAGSVASSLLGKKKTTVKENPLVTAARAKLYRFADTGTFGDFTAGEAYTGSFGNYDPTEVEQASLGRLGSFVTGANPEIFSLGESTLKDLLSTDRFDPYSSTGEYSGYKREVEKQLGEGATRLKRNAAFGRNLYSSKTVESMGDLEEEGQAQLSGKLAELYDKFVDRKISGIGQAAQYGAQSQDMEAQRIGAGFQYGGLTRELDTAEATARLSDYYRQREELTLPINAAQSILGSGLSELTLPNASNPWADTISNIGSTGIEELLRQYYANKKGA